MRHGERVLRLMLEPLEAIGLNAPETTEVVVNRPGEVWVEASGKWRRHEMGGLTFDRLRDIAKLSAAYTQQDVGQDKPLCATTLPDGQRMQICLPPAVEPGTVSLTIRCPSSWEPTLETLSGKGMFERAHSAIGAADDLETLWAKQDLPAFLREAVRARRNVILCGATGSGKTTVSGALLRCIPPEERIITIEDTAELKAPHGNQVSLFYSKGEQGAARVTVEELLHSSLRMRPDRVILQELRDGSAFTYLRAVVAGHPGSITTCHADTAAGAFDALRLMVRENPHGATLSDADVRDLLYRMVDVVAHFERRDGRYGITEILYPRGDRLKAAA